MDDDLQVLRTRNDPSPVTLRRSPDEGADTLTLESHASCTWAEQSKSLSTSELRPRIEPWLTALFQSEHLSLLVGSGLTHAVHYLAAAKALPGMQSCEIAEYTDAINTCAKKAAANAGRKEGNIEDQLRTANELLRGLQILASKDDELTKLAASRQTETKS